jgi:hypothetical protein
MAADTAPQPPPARGVNAPGEPWTTVRRRMGFPQSAGVALDRCQPSTAKPLVGSWPGSRRPPQRRVVGELVPAAFAVALDQPQRGSRFLLRLVGARYLGDHLAPASGVACEHARVEQLLSSGSSTLSVAGAEAAEARTLPARWVMGGL